MFYWNMHCTKIYSKDGHELFDIHSRVFCKIVTLAMFGKYAN